MQWNLRTLFSESLPLEQFAVDDKHLEKFRISRAKLEKKVIDDLKNGSPFTAMMHCGSNNQILFVIDNIKQLKAIGKYEEALLQGLTMPRVNLLHVQLSLLQTLLSIADREKMAACGDPLPTGDRFDLYRGVSGTGAARRLRGISWTVDFERAKWFAKRFNLAKPTVFKASVERGMIYAYDNGRTEQEFICLIPKELNFKLFLKGSEGGDRRSKVEV